MYDEFDEFSTPDEKEMEYQRKKKVFDAMNEDQVRYNAEKAAEAAQAEQTKIFTDALSEAGLDEKSFAQLVNLDPQGTQDVFKSHVQSYVKTVARRRNPKTGQFLPGKPKQVVTDRAERLDQSVREKRKRFDPKTSQGTDQDVHNMVLDVLADDPMMDYGS